MHPVYMTMWKVATIAEHAKTSVIIYVQFMYAC